MEKTEGAFTPEDRIGALEMQALSVLDNRHLLGHMVEVARRMDRSQDSVEKLWLRALARLRRAFGGFSG